MSTKSYALFSLAALMFTGCVETPEQFAKTAARLYCKRYQECDKSFFDEEYGGDLSRCKGDVENDFLDLADELDEIGCDYDKAEAKKCVKAARANKNDCSDDAGDDIDDECAEVWDCPGDLQLGNPVPSFGLVSTPSEEGEQAEPATVPERNYVAPPRR